MTAMLGGRDRQPGSSSLVQTSLSGGASPSGPGKRTLTEQVANQADPAAPPVSHHYEVQLKAWLPFDKVVDPEEPARAEDWFDTYTSTAGAIADFLPVNAKPLYEYHSYYRGDSHVDYPGSYRVLSVATFDFDGKTITGFHQVGTYGESHRDYDYRVWVELSAGLGPFLRASKDIEITSGSGTDSKTAKSATSGEATSATTFKLGISSANPLVMTWAPTIDSDLTGTLDPSGGLVVSFSTDLFPSHGIQVTRDGAVVAQQIVNDPSGIDPLGVRGAGEIGYRLVSQSNKGTVNAP